MKISFEIARGAPQKAGAINGASLRPPYSPEALAVPAEAVRDYQELRSLVSRMNRNMDAASVDNFTQDLRGSYMDANSEMYPYNYTVRARARTIAGNTAHGKGTCRTYADNVVGDDPFELELKIPKVGHGGQPVKNDDGSLQFDKELSEAICSAWNIFGWQENFTTQKTMDRMESLRMAEMGRVRDGMTICRLYPRYPKNDFGFAVRFLERDHLQEQWSGKSPSDGAFGAGNPIIGSIEYDPEWGDALAYWLLTRHPGDAYSLVTIPVDEKNFRVQVPADQVILFDNPRTRANQATGNTELDATILPLWRIHQYDKSLTLSSIASASKPWWVEEDNPTGLELPGEIQKLVDAYKVNVPNGILSESPGQDQVATQASGGPKKNVVRPASREEFPAGKRLKQADPKFPIEAAHTFRQDNERDLATGTHGSYQQMSGDYQNLGFVAGLMSQIPFQRNIKVRQKTMAEDLRPMFRAWLKSTILKGYFEKRGVFVSITRVEEIVEAAYFKGQQADFVNPLLQMQTLILGNEVGAITDQQFQDALPNGRPIEEIYTQRKYEQEMKLKLGLMAPSVVATMPNINKEGEAAPGQEKPAESVAGGEGPATPPPKTTVQTPHPGRKRGEIDANTRMLLEMSQNGH